MHTIYIYYIANFPIFLYEKRQEFQYFCIGDSSSTDTVNQ